MGVWAQAVGLHHSLRSLGVHTTADRWILSSPPSSAPTTRCISWAGLSPTELQSNLNICKKTKAKPTTIRNKTPVCSHMFLCIKDERTNICAINSASKMLLAILDHPLHHQLSLWGGFQPPPLLAPRLGKPKPVERDARPERERRQSKHRICKRVYWK